MKNDIIYFIAICIIKFLNALPREWAIRIGGVIGEIWYVIVPKDRKMAHKQMSEVLGYKDGELKANVRATYENIGKNLVDVLRMGNWSPEFMSALIKVEGYEHFTKALEKGKGIIALTGHIGNFELLAAWFGYCKKHEVSVIGRELYDRRFDKMLTKQRAKLGMKNIPTTSSIKAIIGDLKNNYAIGILLDQDSTRVSGYFIDFFGRKALTAAGPMFIARKTGSAVVPMAIYRQPDDKYIIRIYPELNLSWGDNKEEDITNALIECNKAVEKLIMRDPTQWVWMHNRWRHRPPGENEKK